MGKYKMLCLDIDGTLLDSEHRISPNTKEAIGRASKEQQVLVVLVSARMPKGIDFLRKELNIDSPFICYSGGLIMDDDGKALADAAIPVQTVRQVSKLAAALGIHMSLYKADAWHVENNDAWAQQEGAITHMAPEIVIFEELFDLWEKECTGPNKILCMAPQEELKVLNEKLKDCSRDDLNVFFSKPTYLEIMAGGASKNAAIAVLCERYGIPCAEVMAIGDNFNDISMIEYAGLGIAMGNAPDAVKACADDVTLSNDADGVAAAIIKYVL